MHDHLLQRLRQLIIRLSRDKDDLTGLDVKELRGIIDEDRARKEAELADLDDAEFELDDIEAAIASYQGGPDSDDSASDTANPE